MNIRDNAVRYVSGVLRNASDWQEGERALANHPTYGPWLKTEAGNDDMAIHALAQSIIRDAEQMLGNRLPY